MIKKTKNKNIFKLTKPIQLITPKMKLLFKVEELYKNIILKMEFFNLQNNIKMQDFLTKIQEIELSYFNKLQQYMIDNYYNKTLQLKSQLCQHKQFNPYLITKILKKNTKYNQEIITKVKNSNNETMNLFSLQPNDLMTMKIIADNIFITNNNEVVIKWKISDILI